MASDWRYLLWGPYNQNVTYKTQTNSISTSLPSLRVQSQLVQIAQCAETFA